MPLPRDVFKQKMAEGRAKAAELRNAKLRTAQKGIMEDAVALRLAQIKAEEDAYGGYSSVSQPEVPAQPDIRRAGNVNTPDVRVQDLPRGQRPTQNGVSAESSTAALTRESSPIFCQLCKGFPWTNVPINIARDRFKWLIDEVARVGHIMTNREAEFSRVRGCSVCGGHPVLRDHWYFCKTSVDRATGVEHTLYACSQPCYIDLPRKFPALFGVTHVHNPTP